MLQEKAHQYCKMQHIKGEEVWKYRENSFFVFGMQFAVI